jgi:Tryptophan-associated transmembrane protein (Trp_oprn_chp).
MSRTTSPPRTAASRRTPWIWALACAAGAGLVLLAAGREWAVVRYGAAGAALGEVALTGGELAAVLGPAALAALAAVVAVLAARGPWRRLIGVVVALCGAAVALGVWAGLRQETVLDAAAGRSALSAAGDATWRAAAAWPVLAAAGGLVLVAGGAFAAARAGRWPGMSDRYERRGGGRGGRAVPAARTAGPGRERELWDAIDQGDDPTADTGRADTS